MLQRTVLITLALALPLSAHAAIEEQRAPAAEKPAAPPAAPVLTKAPELLKFVSAAYPPALLAQNKSGDAVMVIDIDEHGLVERVELESATAPEFGEAAMLAAAQFVFSPAEIDGKPAGIRIEYRYVFEPAIEEPDAVAGEPEGAQEAQEEQPVTFAGLIREAGNRKAVAGAVILVDGRSVAESGADGSFAVRGLQPGKHKVKVKSPYHDDYEVEEEISTDERLEVKYYLLRTGRDPYETFVISKSERREASKVQLQRKELEKVPGTGGDPIRVLENLPGMSRVPGGLGGALLVRGARPQDSAVFMDGVQIPLIYHFGGLTSVVNSSFLERIDFYPGGFGARYGRAIAGVVDVVSRELDCDLVHGSAKIDFIDTSAYTCVPLGEWSLGGAARRSYVDLWLPKLLDAIPRDPDAGVTTASPVYADYQLKTGRTFGRNRFDIFAFGSDDRLSIHRSGSDEDINFNVGVHLTFHRVLFKHRYDFGNGTTLTSSFAPGYDRNSFEGKSSEIDASLNFAVSVWSFNWREDFTTKINDWLVFNAGVDNLGGTAHLHIDGPVPTNPRMFPSPFFDFSNRDLYDRKDLKGFGQGYWAEAVATPLEGLKLVPGLRFERHDFHHTQGYSLVPRFSTRYQLLPDTTLKGAYGWYVKAPEPQYLVDSVGNPKLKPEEAHQFVLGVEQGFSDVVNLDVQGFYNLKRHLIVPSDKQTYVNGKEVDEIWSNEGQGKAYGLEILLRHLATADGNFFGWVAYTLSRSVQQDKQRDVTEQVSGNGNFDVNRRNEREAQEYLVEWDQTHILTVVGQWTLPKGWEAGFRFRLVSGNPYTPLNEGLTAVDTDGDRYTVDLDKVPRNSARMPIFHQLDIRVDKTFTFDLWTLGIYLELLNAYYAHNVEAIQYDYRYRGTSALSLLPILPNFGIRGEF